MSACVGEKHTGSFKNLGEIFIQATLPRTSWTSDAKTKLQGIIQNSRVSWKSQQTESSRIARVSKSLQVTERRHDNPRRRPGFIGFQFARRSDIFLPAVRNTRSMIAVIRLDPFRLLHKTRASPCPRIGPCFVYALLSTSNTILSTCVALLNHSSYSVYPPFLPE